SKSARFGAATAAKNPGRACRRRACTRPSTVRTPMNHTSLRELEQHDAFVARHIGPNETEIAQMLRVLGHETLDQLTDAIVPAGIKSQAPLALPDAASEVDALARLRGIARRN